jgi:hypothetical protein
MIKSDLISIFIFEICTKKSAVVHGMVGRINCQPVRYPWGGLVKYRFSYRAFVAKSSENKLPTSAGKSVFGPTLTFLREISYFIYKNSSLIFMFPAKSPLPFNELFEIIFPNKKQVRI